MRHAQIAGELAALEVDVLGCGEKPERRSTNRSMRASMSSSSPSARPRKNLRAQPDSRQAAPQHIVVRHTGGGDVGGGGQRKVDDPAPVRLGTGR